MNCHNFIFQIILKIFVQNIKIIHFGSLVLLHHQYISGLRFSYIF